MVNSKVRSHVDFIVEIPCKRDILDIWIEYFIRFVMCATTILDI